MELEKDAAPVSVTLIKPGRSRRRTPSTPAAIKAAAIQGLQLLSALAERADASRSLMRRS
jgi:hypothetical protein